MTDSTTLTPGLVRGPDGLVRPAWAEQSDLLRNYYDHEWGRPVRDETGVFERLSLEVFQSGLSWATVLKKRPAFRAAFAGFDPDRVAAFDNADVERLLADAAIIRNRAKILATIDNAKATVALRETGVDLAAFVWAQKPDVSPVPLTAADVPTTTHESVALAKALKAAGFRWVGPTTIFALMEAIGLVNTHIVGSHRRPDTGEGGAASSLP
ncbi:DNA-3-methyladenine glycosylase I [Microbacterium amylolyticum]|uniref:DNA-3-methyladenine glycosylase I n=1 Tax=Microbacterium amylolyticum TaxID=936337 RepID=A0ABS4ZJT9_9MICO|nr:DNA-3-methyladenine glycosylase I [Microbacterium amylolyticum]MBP2437273.1 DNA-3-methyladenine glycosylase I [Microbacterium amylolyticum]